MTRKEAARRLREIADEIYDMLEEMEDVIKEVAPKELGAARIYWMARIDEALLNRKGRLRGSFISLRDTLASLEEEEEVEDEEGESEGVEGRGYGKIPT